MTYQILFVALSVGLNGTYNILWYMRKSFLKGLSCSFTGGFKIQFKRLGNVNYGVLNTYDFNLFFSENRINSVIIPLKHHSHIKRNQVVQMRCHILFLLSEPYIFTMPLDKIV